MKKLLSILFALSMAVSLTAAISANSTGETSTAAYATVAPVIDGQIDEIWNHTAHQTISVPEEYEYDITGGYTAILWDETGYYLLAVVEDISLTENDPEARNSVDFWFSEANTKTDLSHPIQATGISAKPLTVQNATIPAMKRYIPLRKVL